MLRVVYPEVPPRTEYSLTELGVTLKEPLGALCQWRWPISMKWRRRAMRRAEARERRRGAPVPGARAV